MSLLKDVIGYGTHADRPAAGSEGRLYYETDTGTLFRDSGTTWVGLSLAGGGGSIPTPSVRACNSALQTIPSGVWTILTFDTTTFDVGTSSPQHSTSTNPSRLTAQAPGVYHIAGLVSFDTGPGGRGVQIRLNGTTLIHQIYDDESGGYHYRNISFVWELSVGDYIELMALQGTGGDMAILTVGGYSPAFMMVGVA